MQSGRSERVRDVVAQNSLQTDSLIRVDESVSATVGEVYRDQVSRRRPGLAVLPGDPLEDYVRHGEAGGGGLTIDESRRGPGGLGEDREHLAILGDCLVVIAKIRLAGIVAPTCVESAVGQSCRLAPAASSIV